jgi:hypothetical protein
MSDSVTWEQCPSCGRPAAVAWLDGVPAEFDCPAGCSLSEDQIGAFADKRRSPVEWLTRSLLQL